MPTPIDHCAACHSPVYVEAAVSGGCACQERDFRILLAQKRASNSSNSSEFSRVSSAQLPSLTPEMLMSAEGRREFQAAQGVRVPNPVPDRSASEADEFLGLIESRPSTLKPSMSLEAMWLQSSGIPYDAEALLATGAPPDDFEFSSDDIDIENASSRQVHARTEGVRFRVDRATAPQGGILREVGRTGRFPILASNEGPPASRIQEDTRVRETLSERPSSRPGLTTKEANARQFVKTLQERQKLPTVYDRLQNSVFDDD